MNTKKISYLFAITSLSMIFPLVSFSENINSNNFKIAVNKNKKPANTKKTTNNSASLLGSWKDAQGLFTLVFTSNTELEFNGDIANYTLVSGVIRVAEAMGNVDYPYNLKGDTLVINFPEGEVIEFHRIGKPIENIVSTKNTKGKNKKPSSSDCNTVHLPAEYTGGCHISLVTPSICEEIDLSNGKTYQFAWQTGGTFCETPFKLYIAGNPVTEENTRMWQYSTKAGQVSRTGGGFDYISAQNLSQLTSNNGIYHWVVTGWFGSHPNSQTFRVKM